MCQRDGKMRWQIGGNVESVKTICEFNWHECPWAILNYIWSEIVTDVVECLSSETMLWRVLATIFVCTLVAHTVYCKIRWMDETAINRENLNRVSFKVQDLELKVNILTYKMQYGAWPLPRDMHGTEFEENELHKLKLTFSNSKQRNGWIKHLLLSPKQNGRSITPHTRSGGSRSVECLARLIDLQTKYMPTRFYHELSPGGSNMARTSSSAILSEKSTRHTKVGNAGSRNKLPNHHDALKSDNVILPYQDMEKTKLTIKKWPTSNGDVSSETYTNNLQTVLHGKSKKPFEKLIRVADECRKFMKDIKRNNKSFTLIDSLPSESKNENRQISRTAEIKENIEKEPVDDKHKKSNERERGGGSLLEEKRKDHEESFENFFNSSNNVTPIISHEEMKTYSPSASRVSKSDLDHSLRNTVDRKNPELLPPDLSITLKKIPDPEPLLKKKTETILDIENTLKNEVIQSKCEFNNTNAILHSVKDKLENLHEVLRTYDAQNDSEVALQSKAKTLQVISKVKESMESKVTKDLSNAQKNENIDKIFSKNTYQFCMKDEMSSDNEKYDTNETTRSSNSSLHSRCRLNIFSIDEKTAHDNSNKMEKHISNEDWTYEKTKTAEIKNDDDNDENNENNIFQSNTMTNESEKKIRNFYRLTSISNNTSSVSSRESVSSSPRNDVLVSQKLSECDNKIEYHNQVDSSSNLEEEINPKNKMALRNKEEVIQMETEEDITIVSQTSSQKEISNSSDLELESKSTVQLLQEALVFKKVLLSQMKIENNSGILKDENQINNEENNNLNASHELSWNKNENRFQSKLLDIISEEQSASSSTEKTGKNSNKNCIGDRFQNDPNILKTCSNNDDRCKKSKDVLPTASSEYFSLTSMQNSEKNLKKCIWNDDNVFHKTKLKSTVTSEKMKDTEEKNSFLEKTTCTINTSAVTTLNNIEKESQDNNGAILNENEVSDKVYRVEEKNLLENNVNQLDLQNVQQVQNHNKGFVQNREEANEAAREEAMRQQEDENLNIVQTPRHPIPWRPIAESSSEESVKQFENTFPDTKFQNLNVLDAQGSTNLECPKGNSHNLSQKSNNFSLKRRPGIFSLPDSKTLKTDNNLISFDNNEKSIDTCTLQYISTQENNLDTKCSIESYSVNEVLDENIMNAVTLDKWYENDQNSFVTIDTQENSSPLTGRTVVLPVNNMFIDVFDESTEKLKDITPEIDVMHDLILLENTPRELDNVKDEMNIVINEANSYIDYSALELLINVSSNKHDEERLDSTQPTVNQEEILKNSISKINSQPSSLYFTDEASLSEIKLNSVCFSNLDPAVAQNSQTESNVTNDNMQDIESQTIAISKSRCIINKLHDVQRLNLNPVVDDIKDTESVNLENNKITQELDNEISLNISTLIENNKYSKHGILDLNMKSNTSLTNKSNTDDMLQTADVGSKHKNGHMCAVEKESNSEKSELKPLIGTVNLNSDTSNSFVSVSNQDVVKSNSNNIILEKPVVSGPFNKSEISSINKSTRCSSASQLSRLPWSTRTTPLSSSSSLKSKKLEKPVLTKPEVIHNRHKMKCKSMDLQSVKIDNHQLSAKSHSSLKFSGQCTKYLSSQSGTEIPQRRSRSSVTPRKSQISPRDDNFDNYDNRGNQTSRSRDYTPRLTNKNLEGNVTTLMSQLKTTAKTMSKSCIPILKSRFETDKKLESEMRSKSPTKGPMKITSSQVDEVPCTLTQLEATSDLLEGNICQSQCVKKKEMEDQNKSGDIINILELQDISEHYADLEQINIPNNSSVRDSDRSIIYMNIVTDQDHMATKLVDTKRFVKCIQGNELKIENVHQDKVDRNYESKKTSSVSMDEHVSPILTTISTIIDDNLLTDKRAIKSSKLVMTDKTKDSCSIAIEHKEIEVSVKPSVMDTSTSISDLPDVVRSPRNLMEEFKIFEVPKELTKEEYIVLLETLNQDPNLLQFRRMQKLCSKLGLGFRE